VTITLHCLASWETVIAMARHSSGYRDMGDWRRDTVPAVCVAGNVGVGDYCRGGILQICRFDFSDLSRAYGIASGGATFGKFAEGSAVG